MKELLTDVLSPTTLAWVFPGVLLLLKFSFRNFVNKPQSKVIWLTIGTWFAFDVVFLSIGLCSGLLLARVKVADGLAAALLVFLVLWITLGIWVSFAATNFATLIGQTAPSQRALAFWFFLAYVPACTTFIGSVVLLGLP